MSQSIRAALAIMGVLSAVACNRLEPLSALPPDLAGIDVARGPAPAYRDAISAASVTVGQDAATPWASQVSPAQVQAALAQTLAAARLGAGQGGRFRLDAVLLTLQRPYAGFAMTVTATIAYRLTEVATGSVVYASTLTTLGTATLDDAVMNDVRLRIADERAVRANVRRLVEEIYALPERSPVTSYRRR